MLHNATWLPRRLQCGEKSGVGGCQPLFTRGTDTLASEFTSINNFEVMTFLVVLGVEVK